MTFAKRDHDEFLHASERFRNAADAIILYLESGNHHQATQDKLWQQMEEAREELWTLRASHTGKPRLKNNGGLR